MDTLKRRRFLGILGSLAACYPFSSLLVAAPQTPPSPRLQPDTPIERVALVLMRIVNTVEARTFGTADHYVSADVLLSGTDFRELSDEFGATQFLASTPTGYILPPYRMRLDLTKSGYIVLLVDMVTGTALKSDEQGLILTGTSKNGSGAASLDPNDFVGLPLQRKSVQQASARHSVRGFLAAAVGTFFPVLSAQVCCGTCCCQSCGYCDGPGPCACAPARCCNVGIVDCTWCCSGPGCLCCTGACNDP